MSRLFASLAEPNYRLYAAGSLVSNVGTWMMNTAQAWLVLELTGDGAAVGVAVALQLLPTLLLGPVGGVLADRHPKRTLLVVSQLAMALPALALGVLALTGVVELWHAYLLCVVAGVGRAFEAPARLAFVPELVGPDHVGNAVSLNSASFNAGRLLGPALAGAMIAATGGGAAGTGWVMVVNAASFGASCLAVVLLDGNSLRPVTRLADRRRALRAAFGYVTGRPDLVLVFLCVFFVGAFGMNFQITSALMARDEFGRGAGEYGLLGTLLAVGSLSGALVAARRQPGSSALPVIVGAALLLSAVQVVSGVMPTFASYAAVLPLQGVAFLVTGAVATSHLQLTADPAVRGRVTALYVTVFVGSVPLVAPAIGWVGDVAGARTAVVLSGAVSGVGVLLALAWFAMTAGSVTERAQVREAARASR